jgi:hypothetical protein
LNHINLLAQGLMLFFQLFEMGCHAHSVLLLVECICIRAQSYGCVTPHVQHLDDQSTYKLTRN